LKQEIAESPVISMVSEKNRILGRGLKQIIKS